jgi:hypothetical protein
MLSSLIENVMWLTSPLLLLVFFRHKLWYVFGVFLLMFSIGINQGSLVFSDLWMLPIYTDLLPQMITVFLWLCLGLLLGSNGRAKQIGNPVITSFFLGFFIGEWGGALWLLKRCKDGNSRSKLICAVLAGGLVSPFGDIGWFTMLQETWKVVYFIPLSIIALLFAKGEVGEELETKSESIFPYILGGLTGLMSLVFYEQKIIVLAVALFVAIYWTREYLSEVPFRWAGLFVFSALAINITVAGGTNELIAWGLEDVQYSHPSYLLGALSLGTVALSCFLGEMQSVIFASAVMERSLDIQLDGVYFMMAAGISIGGSTPILIAKCLSNGWKIYAGLLLISIIYLLLLSQYVVAV